MAKLEVEVPVFKSNDLVALLQKLEIKDGEFVVVTTEQVDEMLDVLEQSRKHLEDSGYGELFFFVVDPRTTMKAVKANWQELRKALKERGIA